MLRFSTFNRSKKYANGIFAFVNKHNARDEIIVIVQKNYHSDLVIVKINGEVKRWGGVKKGILLKDFADKIQSIFNELQ